MLSRTTVFTRRVADHPAPVTVADPATSCVEVVTRLREQDATAVVIVDSAGAPLGILTEQDIARRVTFRVEPDTPVSRVMSRPVQSIPAETYLHHAVARMRRERIRHLPVIDDDRVVGLLELDRVLADLSGRTVADIDLVDHVRTPGSMQAAKRKQAALAARLLADQVPAADIQQLLTRLNHQLCRDAVDCVLEQMTEEGLGTPPVAFEVLLMGSGGRGESYLCPDQDNGLILADYPDNEHTAIDGWFILFSERLTETLNEIGFPYCHGHVMATNPLWRKTLSQWRAQTRRWVARSEGQVLRLADIFFDFVCVYGTGTMTAELREYITAISAQPFFLREMYKVDQHHKVALGPFGRLLPERGKGPHRGSIDLKLAGTLPLVEAIRILALQQGVSETATLERIAALYQQGVLSRDERDALEQAYRHIARLLLRQQLENVEADREPGNHVPIRALSRLEKDQLVAGFRAIRALRSRVHTALTGELF